MRLKKNWKRLLRVCLPLVYRKYHFSLMNTHQHFIYKVSVHLELIASGNIFKLCYTHMGRHHRIDSDEVQ